MIEESGFHSHKFGQAIEHLKPCLEELYLRDTFKEMVNTKRMKRKVRREMESQDS